MTQRGCRSWIFGAFLNSASTQNRAPQIVIGRIFKPRPRLFNDPKPRSTNSYRAREISTSPSCKRKICLVSGKISPDMISLVYVVELRSSHLNRYFVPSLRPLSRERMLYNLVPFCSLPSCTISYLYCQKIKIIMNKSENIKVVRMCDILVMFAYFPTDDTSNIAFVPCYAKFHIPKFLWSYWISIWLFILLVFTLYIVCNQCNLRRNE